MYYTIYCKFYFWYKKYENGSAAYLRLSALILLSAFFYINFLSIITLVGLINKHTPVSKEMSIGAGILFFIINYIVISLEKSNCIIAKFKDSKQGLKERKKSNYKANLYIILSLLFFIICMSLVAYVKNKYGNYDLPNG